MRIGIWGPKDAGKSTFIASISFATLSPTRDGEKWLMNFVPTPTDGSSSAQNQSDKALSLWRNYLNKKKFPPPTLQSTSEPYQWEFTRKVEASADTAMATRGGLGGLFDRLTQGALLPELTTEDEQRFDLGFYDQPGEVFTGSESAESMGRDKIIDYFRTCQGMVFLFDPFEPEANLMAFTGVVHDLHNAGGLRQPLAVCCGKIDDPRIFKKFNTPQFPEELKSLELTDVKRSLTDLNASRHPARHVRLLLEDEGGYGLQLLSGIDTYFHNDNVQFFLMSAIGFRKSGSEPDNFVNFRFKEFAREASEKDNQDEMLTPQAPQADPDVKPSETYFTPVINGPVDPENVLDPLVWVFNNIDNPESTQF